MISELFKTFIDDDTIAREKADYEKTQTYNFKFKPGSRVQYKNKSGIHKAIVAQAFIRDGKPRYYVYPPGKKNQKGSWVWVHEKDLKNR